MSTFGTTVIGTAIVSTSGPWHNTYSYTLSSVTNGIASYDISAGTQHGIQIHAGNVLKVNGVTPNAAPASYSIGSTHYSNDDGVIASGDVITLHNVATNASYILVFSVTADHLWTSGSGSGTLATTTWTPSFAKQSALSMIITATITGTPSSSFPLTAQKDFKLYKLTNGVQTQVSTTVQFLNNTSTMTQFRTFTYAVGSTYYYRHADNGQLMGPMYPPPDIPPSTRKKVHSNFW